MALFSVAPNACAEAILLSTSLRRNLAPSRYRRDRLWLRINFGSSLVEIQPCNESVHSRLPAGPRWVQRVGAHRPLRKMPTQWGTLGGFRALFTNVDGCAVCTCRLDLLSCRCGGLIGSRVWFRWCSGLPRHCAATDVDRRGARFHGLGVIFRVEGVAGFCQGAWALPPTGSVQ